MARILLIDGDEDRSTVTSEALGEAQHDVHHAPTASFALTTLEWRRPDLIVSRAEIPDMDGYALCTIVRSDPKTKDIPFLLLAAGGPTAGAAARAGVDMVLAGSFSSSDVVDSVRRLL